MGQYVGLDVSQKLTALCVIDESGQRIWQGTCRSSPSAIAQTLQERVGEAVRVGMETGPLAVWLYHGLHELGVPIVCIHARHVHAALSVQLNKTDGNDAHGIAQLVRSGWYRPVEVKSLESHELRLLLSARAKLVGMRTALYSQIRGVLKTFGVVLRPGRRGTFERLVLDATPQRAAVAEVVGVLLETWREISDKIRLMDRAVHRAAKANKICTRFMSVPGVGPNTALAFYTCVDDPRRFARVTDVGAYLGLTPKKYQSGDVDRNTSISKCGDRLTRYLLVEAAGVLLRRTRMDSALKRWGLRLVPRVGFRKAIVAMARKLSTLLLSIWRDESVFRPAG
ncbi:MAG: IS110 family transposase [Burkholderiales bacterium]|nr:IS110 family transposase [Burkholderiales bacterium]